MSPDNKFNHIKYSVIAIFIVTLSGVPAYFFWHSKKTAVVTEQKAKAETEQDFALAADKLLANEQITEIKTLKHIWELVPFVGKSVQLYGRAAISPSVKGSGSFLIDGNLKLEIPANFSQQSIEKQQVRFIDENGYLISPFMLVSGSIIFEYLDTDKPENLWRDRTGASLLLTNIEIIHIFEQCPTGEERPADVSLAPPNEALKQRLNSLFNGLKCDADMISFARYISILDRQKEAEIKSGKIISASSNPAVNSHKASEINFLADLIPFVGSMIELKGKVIKKGNSNFFVIGNKGNILLPMYSVTDAFNENETVIVSGELEYKYYIPTNRHTLNTNAFCPPDEGCLFFANVHLIKKLSENEIHDNSIPCIKEIADARIWRARKAFVTGCYGDADEISFRKFIINMMKEEAAEKNNPHRPR